jgi:cell division protein FtsL
LKSIYAVHRPVHNAYLVRQRDRRRVRELLLGLVGVLPLAVAFIAYTWIHLEVLRTGYRIDELDRRLHGLQEEERRLRLEASYLASPERIEERAREVLGMSAPAVDQLIFAAEIAGGGR